MNIRKIISILLVCSVVTITNNFITSIYGGMSLLSMPEEQIKYLGSDVLSMYIKNGQNLSFIEEIVYSFNSPWFWNDFALFFFALFVPMVIASSILVFGERYYQTKT